MNWTCAAPRYCWMSRFWSCYYFRKQTAPGSLKKMPANNEEVACAKLRRQVTLASILPTRGADIMSRPLPKMSSFEWLSHNLIFHLSEFFPNESFSSSLHHWCMHDYFSVNAKRTTSMCSRRKAREKSRPCAATCPLDRRLSLWTTANRSSPLNWSKNLIFREDSGMHLCRQSSWRLHKRQSMQAFLLLQHATPMITPFPILH